MAAAPTPPFASPATDEDDDASQSSDGEAAPHIKDLSQDTELQGKVLDRIKQLSQLALLTGNLNDESSDSG